MDTKLKNSKSIYIRNIVAFTILIIISTGIFSTYPKIKEWAKSEPLVPYENYEILRNIYTSNIVLYKDLLEQEKGQELTGDEVYIKSYEENTDSRDSLKSSINNDLNSWKNDLNENFKNIDYLAYGSDTSIKKTNTDNDLNSLINSNENNSLNDKYAWYMVIKYDQNGGVSVNNVHGADAYVVRNRFSEFTMREIWDYNLQENNNIKFNPIKNATFVYGIPRELKYSDNISRIINDSENKFNDGVLTTVAMIILFSILIFGLMVPYKKGKEVFGIKVFFKIPFEINCIIFGFSALFLGLL